MSESGGKAMAAAWDSAGQQTVELEHLLPLLHCPAWVSDKIYVNRGVGCCCRSIADKDAVDASRKACGLALQCPCIRILLESSVTNRQR